jgi:hypothetical protein
MRKICLFLILIITKTYAQNKLNVSAWSTVAGNSISTINEFNSNGGSQQNSIIWDLDPFGKRALIWKGTCDGNPNANGGWNAFVQNVDANKAYRLSVWVNKVNASSNGYLYFGCGWSHTLNLNNVENNNPYFMLPPVSSLQVGKWYLFVGYIHANNDADQNSYSAVYDGETGKKILSGQDFKNKAGIVEQMQRVYNYYDGLSGSSVYWYAPRFDEINGNEPTIEQLLGTVGKAATLNTNAYVGGNIGIGTPNPLSKLSVYESGSSNNIWRGRSDFGGDNAKIVAGEYNNTAYFGAHTPALNAWANLAINPNGGNVGIGTTNPGIYKLAVEGTIGARKLKVTQSSWADDVFKTNYKLIPITELENFIQENNHLPGVPSEKEVKGKDLDISETQTMLLKKIEELTLYLIESEKKRTELETRLRKIEKKVK